jgi:simple sugar transport system ATP-binding protein
MVGRAVDLMIDKPYSAGHGVALEVRDLDLADPDGRVLLDDISFTVTRGEILAVAGVQGNGQTELAETLVGLRKPTAGQILLHHTADGQAAVDDLAGRKVKHVLGAGVGFVPEDRGKDGMVASFSIAENLVLDQVSSPPFSRGGAMNMKVIADNASQRIEEYDVRTGSRNAALATLSGGNQQKVIVAREISRQPSVLIASQPTRGLDVGSIEFIHTRIVALRDEGAAVIVVSTELNEVAALADRIAVMYRGRFVGIVPHDTPRHILGLMMAGVPYDEALTQDPAHTTTQERAES